MAHYGEERFPATRHIPAHILGKGLEDYSAQLKYICTKNLNNVDVSSLICVNAVHVCVPTQFSEFTDNIERDEECISFVLYC